MGILGWFSFPSLTHPDYCFLEMSTELKGFFSGMLGVYLFCSLIGGLFTLSICFWSRFSSSTFSAILCILSSLLTALSTI